MENRAIVAEDATPKFRAHPIHIGHDVTAGASENVIVMESGRRNDQLDERVCPSHLFRAGKSRHETPVYE
jgi:hypothetical protein